MQYEEEEPAVTMERFARKLRKEFVDAVCAHVNIGTPPALKQTARAKAATIAEVWFYLKTGKDVTDDTRVEFEEFAALLYAEALKVAGQ